MVADQDRDLLSRLNALKRSHVELDQPPLHLPPPCTDVPLDPSPARALGDELSSRFKSLSASRVAPEVIPRSRIPPPSNAANDGPADEHQNFDDEVHALLASLGPEEQWDIQHDDQREIEELLKAAQTTLSDAHHQDPERASDNEESGASIRGSQLPAVDVSVFQPDPDLDDNPSNPVDSDRVNRQTLDAQADDVLQRILDEIQHEPAAPHREPEGDVEHDLAEPDPSTNHSTSLHPALDLPSTPNKEPLPPTTKNTDTKPPPSSSSRTTEDDDLSSRFASLSLPSVPTSFKRPTVAPPPDEPDDEEIDTWCTICLADATLSCPGCDGELYCAACWVEGHRGPDAGYEERTHRAVVFVRPKKQQKKKQKLGRVRVATGA